MLAGLIQGSSVATAQALPNFEDCIPLWTASLKAKRQATRTIEGYEQDVRRYLRHDPQPTRLSIEAYLARRFDEVSSARVAAERKALRSFFKFLRSSGLVPTDPTADLEGFKISYGERVMPTRQDIDKLLKTPLYRRNDTPKFHTMTLLLANTGLRLGEACSIRKPDIDFDRLEIMVMGKGRKARTVPISDYMAQALKAWIARDGHSQWLFPANTKTGYWDEKQYERSFRRHCKRCDVKPFTPHALRHYFATHSLRNGARLEVVSRILGHASVSITADIYTHIDEEEIHETHQKFSPFASGR